MTTGSGSSHCQFLGRLLIWYPLLYLDVHLYFSICPVIDPLCPIRPAQYIEGAFIHRYRQPANPRRQVRREQQMKSSQRRHP